MFERAKFGAGIMADETPGSTAAANAAHEGSRAAGGCDPMALLRATAQRAVKDLADGVVIAALVEGEHPRVSPFIVEHRTPEGTAHAREFVAADNSQSPLLRRVIESGETCIVNHLSAARAPETVAPDSLGFFTKVPLASLMIAPVFEKRAMIGTFGCWREGEARPFESRDQRAVERLARSVAPALFRSRSTRHPAAGPGPVLEGWLELTHELLATSNPEGFLSDLNPAWEHTLGWPREVLSSRPLIAFVHPADVEKTLAALSRTYFGE